MPRRPRRQFEGAFYHVFNRGVEKRPIVFDDTDRKTFLALLANAIQEFQLRLFAYCLMDNHFHLFLQTPLPNLAQAMRNLQGQHAQYINVRHNRVGALFQGRYKDRLVGVEAYAFALTRYIHTNPIEAGLVEHPEGYPWSSYPSYIGMLPKWKWLDTHWLLAQFHEQPTTALEQFKKFHHLLPEEKEIRALRNMRKPLGNPQIPLPLVTTREEGARSSRPHLDGS